MNKLTPNLVVDRIEDVLPFYLSVGFTKSMDLEHEGSLGFVILGVVNSAISIYYYLRIVTAMYFRESTAPFQVARSPGLLFVIAFIPLLVLELGIMPGWWLKLIG